MKLLFACLVFLTNFWVIFTNCPPLSPPIGGVFVSPCLATPGSVCIIKCTIDRATHKRECLENGTWTGGIIRCHKRKKCRKTLLAPENGYIVGDCKRKIGTICTFACNSGFRLVGPSQLICEKNGQWSGLEPKCEPKVTCPQLPIPTLGLRYGVCHQSAPVKSTCFFSCAEGWALVGNSVLLCTEKGSWNGTAPTCKKISTPTRPKQIPCPGLVPIQFGNQIGSCNPGIYKKTCNFTCYKGYYLVGKPTLTCEINGQWSGAAPSCIKGEGCIPPIPGKGVVITRCKSFLGGKCYYFCTKKEYSTQNYDEMELSGRNFLPEVEDTKKYTVCGPYGEWKSSMGCKKLTFLKFPLLSLFGK